MNSLILDNTSGLITDAHTLQHLHNTLKAKPGNQYRCTILNQGICRGEILSLDENHCQLKLSAPEAGSPCWFNLVVGLSRPQTVKKILEHATTYGAAGIHFFKAELSDKSYLDTKVLEENEKMALLKAGLSQSGCYYQVPRVKADKYNPAQQYAEENQKFILDLTGAKSFLEYAPEIDFNRTVTLAIGPERGFVAQDLERFHAAGFKSVKVSSSILRVEHAVYSAIAQLELIREQF